MEIASEQEYRDAYVFLDWMRQVFKSGWPREGAAFLTSLDALVNDYEREWWPKAKIPGVATVCRGAAGCDHVHTGPMAAWPDEAEQGLPYGRGCLLCGCKRRL